MFIMFMHFKNAVNRIRNFAFEFDEELQPENENK